VNENEKTVPAQITAFWDVVVSIYDSADNVALPATAEYANWVRALRSVLPARSARVLDVGTGTGFVARIAAELGHRVTAIDISKAMLDASAGMRSRAPDHVRGRRRCRTGVLTGER